MKKFFVVLIFFVFCFFPFPSRGIDLGQFQVFIIQDNKNLKLFSDNEKNKYFDFYGENSFSCKVPNVLYEKKDVSKRQIFLLNDNDPNKFHNPITLNSIYVESSSDIVNPSISGFESFTLGPGMQIAVTLDYSCVPSKITKENFWTLIFIKIDIEDSEPLTFSYKKICVDSYSDYSFDYSFIIIMVFNVLVMAWQAKRPKILSTFKEFEGYAINIKFTLFYIVLASILLITLIYSQTVMILIYMVILAIVSFFAFALFVNELLTGNLLRHNISKLLIQLPKMGKVSLFFLVGCLMSIPIIVFWAITLDWILSDILTLILAAALLKIIKFKNLKTATYFFCVEILFEIIWGVAFYFGLEISYDQFFSSAFTLPLKIECLTFSSFLNKKCVWISITNLVFPGLLLSYFNRYDASKNFSIYYFFSLLAFILGNVIWVIIESRFEFSTPASLFCFSLMVIVTLILAHKRNENIELWNGTFYDVELADPLINSRNFMEKGPTTEHSDRISIHSEEDSNLKNDASENSILEATITLDDGSKLRNPNNDNSKN